MALNGNTLGDAIMAAVDAVGDKTDRTALFRAIGNAIVSHITANAQVSTTIQLGSVAAGVTVGVFTAPVTGTTLGTIS